jgi:hypothetical protein
MAGLDRVERRLAGDREVRTGLDQIMRAFNDLSAAARARASVEREIERQETVQARPMRTD